MTKKQKKLIGIIFAIALCIGIIPAADAMHIMEGFISPGYCILWGVLSLPFLVMGFMSIKKKITEHRRTLILLAISGAFIFVISSLKIPSVTGSCSHMTGTGLGAILFGPSAVSVLGIIVLLFQAVLLAHGGLTTIGANTFSMAIAGPFMTFGIYKVCQKLNVNKKVSVFLAAALGDLFTYCVTSFQLAVAYPSESGGIGASMIKFLGVFAVTQIPLAILEGLLSVIIISVLEVYAKNELADLNYVNTKPSKIKGSVIACVLAAVLIAFVPFFALKGADFGGSDDGSMKTGSQSVKDDNGDTFKFYFGTKDSATEKRGRGITGNKNNKLYYMGHLVAADDYKYQPVKVDMNNDGKADELFVVNQNGSIQHSAVQYKEDGEVLIDLRAKDDDGNKWNIAFKDKDAGFSKYAIDTNSTDMNGRIGDVEFIDPANIIKALPFEDATPVTP